MLGILVSQTFNPTALGLFAAEPVNLIGYAKFVVNLRLPAEDQRE